MTSVSNVSLGVPIVFNNKHSTKAEKLLELTSQYFYLGGKERLTIYPADYQHSKPWAMITPIGYHFFSWRRLGIIMSMFTLFIPLLVFLLDRALRYYIDVPSIPLEDECYLCLQRYQGLENEDQNGAFVPLRLDKSSGSKLFISNEIPNVEVAWNKIFSYLTVHEIQGLSQVDDLVYSILDEPQKRLERLARLHKLILDESRLFDRSVRRSFLKKLVLHSSGLGSAELWRSIMKDFHDCYSNDCEGLVTFAEDLKEALQDEDASSRQLRRLVDVLPLLYRPWAIGTIFEQLALSNLEKSKKEYLRENIQKRLNGLTEEELGILSCEEVISIDPRKCFGCNESFDKKDFTVSKLVYEALGQRIIKKIQKEKRETSIVVLQGRVEAEIIQKRPEMAEEFFQQQFNTIPEFHMGNYRADIRRAL